MAHAQFRVTTQVTDDGDLVERHIFSPFRNEIEIFELEVRRAPPSLTGSTRSFDLWIGQMDRWEKLKASAEAGLRRRIRLIVAVY
jgi:hypothetical protein